VQENVTAIRVVKAFVREDHESEKFRHAANELHDLFAAPRAFWRGTTPS
jgi:ATP-binding cassette subfamily B protein